MKKLILLPIGMAVIIASLYFGFHLLGKHIYNRKDCSRFNIDNIELRTGINIPATTEVKCNCEDNHKTSTIDIDTSQVNIGDYITKNKFQRNGENYVNNGDTKNTTWTALLDDKTGKLIIDIDYKN